MSIRIEILNSLSEPTKNGNLYTKEAMSKAIENTKDKIKNKKLFLERQPRTNFDREVYLGDIVGVVNDIEIIDDRLVADIELLSLPHVEEIEKALLDGRLSVRPSGTGVLNKDKEVSDYKFLCLTLTNDPA
jgi:hypothetical protein